MLGETEPRELAAGRSDDTRWSGNALAAAARARPSAATTVALVALAGASVALHSVLVGLVHGPLVFMDELGYERMAQTFAHTGHFSLFGRGGLAYSPLYPIVLSPIYGLTSAHAAYEWAKVENAVLLSLSVFPVYAIARFVLPRGRSLGVVALSLIAPLMLYSGLEMSESLAYPVCLIAIWAVLRAIRHASAANDAVVLAAIVLASTARLELVVLLPAAITAAVFVALLHTPQHEPRGRALLRAVSAHWLLLGITAAALVALLVRRAMNGGALPISGRYANVGTAHAGPLRVLELGVHHLAELDFAVAVIPFAAALLAGYALVRFGFPHRALVFASVATAFAFWLLLEVAFDAAAFDGTSSQPRTGSVDLPRIHERYLIYLTPLFFVALFTVLPVLRSRLFSVRRHLAVAAVAAALPALIPFGTVMNNTSIFESMALQAFGKIVNGRIVSAPHATLAAVLISALLAFGYVRAAARPLPSLAVSMTAVALLGMSALVLERQTIPTSHAVVGLPTHKDWVDRAVGGRGDVALVGGAGVRAIPVDETAFWNTSITRVYHTCGSGFGPGFGDQFIRLNRADGKLVGPNGTIHVRYAVVPTRLGVSGRVLARDPEGRLEVLAPSRGALRIPPDRRSTVRCRA